jgi:hypothetical protein
MHALFSLRAASLWGEKEKFGCGPSLTSVSDWVLRRAPLRTPDHSRKTLHQPRAGGGTLAVSSRSADVGCLGAEHVPRRPQLLCDPPIIAINGHIALAPPTAGRPKGAPGLPWVPLLTLGSSCVASSRQRACGQGAGSCSASSAWASPSGVSLAPTGGRAPCLQLHETMCPRYPGQGVADDGAPVELIEVVEAPEQGEEVGGLRGTETRKLQSVGTCVIRLSVYVATYQVREAWGSTRSDTAGVRRGPIVVCTP